MAANRRTLFLCMFTAFVYFRGVSGDTRSILNHILRGYNRDNRPVVNESLPVQVFHEIVPFHIISFEEVLQKLKISIWIREGWFDEFLTWDPAEFNGTKDVRIFVDRLWQPDILLYENVWRRACSVDEALLYNTEKTYQAHVFHNGRVQYNVPGVVHVYCRVDLTSYPFDTQRCKLKYSSWTFSIAHINLSIAVSSSQQQEFQTGGEWELLRMDTVRNSRKYSCCEEEFPDITYTLVLRRKPYFYVTNIIVPHILLSGLSLLVFYLPPESGEKITLSVTTLLSLIVFNQLVLDTIPATSDDSFPIIGKYFIVMVSIVALTVAASVIVLWTYYQYSTGLPMRPYMHFVIFRLLAPMVGKKRVEADVAPHHPQTTPGNKQDAVKGASARSSGMTSSFHKGLHYLSQALAYDNSRGLSIIDEMWFDGGRTESETTPEMTELGPENTSCMSIRMERNIRELSSSLGYLTRLKQGKERERQFSKDWKEAAVILDHAFFWFFTFVIILMPTVFLLIATQVI
ncbi:neuronal acetylcholine receptor subunit alpha-6-like [Diadema setosum]|uniref:neuronal acetylcholine receptor subunit alpha-6-like n=1 Tax=Diadema setosum TaxID=31175 RepID=UPI003B3BBF5B